MYSFNSVIRTGPAAAGSSACKAEEPVEHGEAHMWPSDAGGAGRQPAPLAVRLTPHS